jgi:hypothetical protein
VIPPSEPVKTRPAAVTPRDHRAVLVSERGGGPAWPVTRRALLPPAAIARPAAPPWPRRRRWLAARRGTAAAPASGPQRDAAEDRGSPGLSRQRPLTRPVRPLAIPAEVPGPGGPPDAARHRPMPKPRRMRTSDRRMVCAHRPGRTPGSPASGRIDALLALMYDGLVHPDAHGTTGAHVRPRYAPQTLAERRPARQLIADAASRASRGYTHASRLAHDCGALPETG